MTEPHVSVRALAKRVAGAVFMSALLAPTAALAAPPTPAPASVETTPSGDATSTPTAPRGDDDLTRPLTIAAGGVLANGVDATGSATRQGGAYLGAAYLFGKDLHFRLGFEYALTSGDVQERLPLPGTAGRNAPLDVRQRQTRHAIDLTLGYRIDAREGREKVWLLPFIGPRSLFLLEDVAPLWGLEGEGGLRVGVTSNAYEVSAFAAYARALAKTSTSDAKSVYGGPLGETRFGASIVLRSGGRFGLSLGYEGDLVELQHERLTYHQLLIGALVSF